MNIQEFIKAKEKNIEYLKIIIEWEQKPEIADILQKISDVAWKKQKPKLIDFLSQSLLEYNEKIKEMCKDKKKRKNSIKFFGGNGYYNQQGYNQALDDIITNLTQDTNPKE